MASYFSCIYTEDEGDKYPIEIGVVDDCDRVRYQGYIRPSKTADPEVIRAAGISHNALTSAPRLEAVFDVIVDVIVGHLQDTGGFVWTCDLEPQKEAFQEAIKDRRVRAGYAQLFETMKWVDLR